MEEKSKNSKKNTNNKDETNANQSNLWNEILREALTNKDLDQSHLFVFGDKNTGKKSILKNINKDLLNKTEFEDSFKRGPSNEEKVSSKFALIDYTYLNIKKLNEADSDVVGKVNVWIINEFLDKEIFETVFKPEYLLKSICVIVVDLSRPWEIIDNLRKWCNYIYDSFGSLMMKFPLEKQEELRNRVVEYVKLYEDLQRDDEGNIRKLQEETVKLRKSLPLKDGLLKTNIGIPIIFAVNKSDVVSSSGEKKRFEEDSEFIFKHIRNLAIGYGATTVYSSTRYNYNLNVLYEYILHRIYNFDLLHPPNVIDRDSYFIPSGYDSTGILKGYDMNDDLSKIYNERIPALKQKGAVNIKIIKCSKDVEIFCEDLQVFLNKYRAGKKVPTSSVNISSNYSTTNNSYPIEIAPSSNGESSLVESRISNSGIKGIKDEFNNNSSLHKKSNTNSNTDFSKFLKNNNSVTSNITQGHNPNDNSNYTSSERKINSVLENVKKNEASRLIKDDKAGDKSKDLMKKIAALRNKKTLNEKPEK